MAFTVNGTVAGEESGNTYLRQSSGITSGACVLTTILDLSADDVLGIASRRNCTITAAGTTVGAKSSISINKL